MYVFWRVSENDCGYEYLRKQLSHISCKMFMIVVEYMLVERYCLCMRAVNYKASSYIL